MRDVRGAIFAAAGLAWCGCSGGSGTPPAAQSAALSVSPSSVSFGSPPAPGASQVLSVSNASAPVTAKLANPLIGSVATVSTGTAQTIVVRPIAAGSTTLTVADGASSVTVPVTVSACAPPLPGQFTLLEPQPGQTVAAVPGSILLSISAPLFGVPVSDVGAYVVVHLVSMDGTELARNAAVTMLASPPLGVRPPPDSAGLAIVSYPAPAVGKTYFVEPYLATSPCLAPLTIGSFST
jgi:hypothetical protein